LRQKLRNKFQGKEPREKGNDSGWRKPEGVGQPLKEYVFNP